MLPTLCRGTVSARLDGPHNWDEDDCEVATEDEDEDEDEEEDEEDESPVAQLTRCLLKQPHGVLHLRLFSDHQQENKMGTRALIDLRCAHTMHTYACMELALPELSMILLCQCNTHRVGTAFNAADCGCSLLSMLRKLSLDNVSLSLPALQPVATRLQSLDILDSFLRGSAAGFLSVGWTALTSLSIKGSWVKSDALTALNLPALESLAIVSFAFGENFSYPLLQPNQLCCPQLRSLVYDFESTQEEDGRRCCSLLHLPRLATLVMICDEEEAARMDVALPASLEHLTVQAASLGGASQWHVPLKWVLLEAVKCIGNGAQLRALTCANSAPSPHPEGTPWGASSVAHYRELAEHLRGLKDLRLSMYGNAETMLSATSVMASSAPDLTRLEFEFENQLDYFELPPICSASLKSVTGRYSNTVPPRPVVLGFLPGCTQLRDVHVHFYHDPPREGTSVKIRCYCISERCIMPLDACAGLAEVGVRFLPMPLTSQGVQVYTVTFTCRAPGPGQALKWGHVVEAGIS